MPDFFATCPRGLEKLLSDELASFGATAVKATDGGVGFSGDWPACYRVNLQSRLASRILWRVQAPTPYRNEQDVYQAAYDLPWTRWFDVKHTILVKVTAIRSPLTSLVFITLKIKDAVCDKFRAEKKERPSVAKLEPDMRIHAFFEGDKFTLYLDTSGDALFKRGVRQYTNIAPLRENLAAGILRMTGWQPGTPLVQRQPAAVHSHHSPGGQEYGSPTMQSSVAWQLQSDPSQKQDSPAGQAPGSEGSQPDTGTQEQSPHIVHSQKVPAGHEAGSRGSQRGIIGSQTQPMSG